jgi:putative oxidoreductase
MKNLQRNVRGVVGVLGRILLCAVFAATVAGYAVPDVRSVAEIVAAKGMIGPTWTLIGGVAILVAGSLSVILGYQARIGAILLLTFLLLTTYCFHGFNFWTVVNAQARQEQIIQLATNLSMIGAVLFIIANGAGPMSLDARR